ncbi:MAG: ABC transporter substrate-binding protein [Candidatus Dormibacteria bacterium]
MEESKVWTIFAAIRARATMWRLLICLAVMAVLAGCGASTPTPTHKRSATVEIGYIAQAVESNALIQYERNQELFAKAAGRLGYAVHPVYEAFSSGPAELEALLSGRLDFAVMGDTPIIRGVLLKEPFSVVALAEGHAQFDVFVRSGSGITDPQDLRGKTIGLIVGTDSQIILNELLQLTFGTSDYSTLGIHLVNIPSPAQLVAVPRGIDATVMLYSIWAGQVASNPGVVPIVTSYGTTAVGYRGPLGVGAGHTLPGLRNSPFYPEGIYAHRTMWIVANSFLRESPKLVTAFVMAYQEAALFLTKQKPAVVAKLAYSAWHIPPNSPYAAQVVKDALVLERGWVWPTSGDFQVFLKLAAAEKQLGILTSTVTSAQLKPYFCNAAGAIRSAWSGTGRVPAQAKQLVWNGPCA